MNYHILYNPLADNGQCKNNVENLSVVLLQEKCCFKDMTEISSTIPRNW